MSDDLINALYVNNINKIRELGADINKVDKYGRTPLEYAISSNRTDIVKLLIELGADINKVDKYGQTLFHRPIFSNRTDIIKLLIELGADINKEDKYGQTPLEFAISWNKIDITKLLIELGADINKEDKYGRTSLMKAISWNRTDDIVKLLIEKGADINKKNKGGKNVYSYTRCKPKISEVLKEAGAIVEDFKYDNFLYLTHVTSLHNLSGILESGKMSTNVDMWYKNKFITGLTSEKWSPSNIGKQYPGVYMTLINEELVGEIIRLLDTDSVTLVFCISLLDREDFHYNSNDNSGYFYKKITSFSKSQLQDDIKKNCIDKHNEVVFHHSVSLKYLKELWVINEEIAIELKELLKKFSIDIPIRITGVYLNNNIVCNIPINKLKRNNCFFMLETCSERENKDKKNIKWYLKNIGKKCGIKDIDKDKDNIDEINKLLSVPIFKEDTTLEEIKEYLRNNGVSLDTIENLSEMQLNELKRLNLVGLNFIKNYSRFDGGKRKKSKSKRKKSKSKRKKSKSKRRKSKSKKRKSKSKRRKSKSKRRKS